MMCLSARKTEPSQYEERTIIGTSATSDTASSKLSIPGRRVSIPQPNRSVALAHFRGAESLETLKLRQELSEVRKVLIAREHRLGELRSHLVSFEGRYLRQVGLLYRRLDEWEQKIAELHGRSLNSEPEDDGLEPKEPASAFDPATLKSVFRNLVKLLHPDFATDAQDEGRRTRLMALANDAYAREDLASIQRMLSGYDPVVTLTSAQNVCDRALQLKVRIAQVMQDVQAIDLQIEDLQRSESATLQKRTLEAARQGRDLLAEMAARVNGRIGLAMRQYELDLSRMQRPSKGLSVESLLTAEIRS